jgi:hypothetical protein
MHARNAIFLPSHMQQMVVEVDLVPPQLGKFRCPEPVPIGNQDRRSIPSTIATPSPCSRRCVPASVVLSDLQVLASV